MHAAAAAVCAGAVAAGAAQPRLAPGLQPAHKMDGARGAFRGVLGKCEADLGLYHGFLPEGEPYACKVADQEVTWVQKHHPGEDLCDWGFGELPPRPTCLLGKCAWSYGLDYNKLAPGAAPGTTDGNTMIWKEGCVSSKAALAGGDTGGRHMAQLTCEANAECRKFCATCPTCRECAEQNQTLNWASSMVVWRITPQLSTFVDHWRGMYHRPNINAALMMNYYAGWVRKVVKCSDVPSELLNLGHPTTEGGFMPGTNLSETEFAVRKWREMDSLMTQEDFDVAFRSPADYTKAVEPAPSAPSFSVNASGGQVTVTLSGPDGKWFGVGFGAQRMGDLPDAVIVEGDGTVKEVRLAEYAAGSALPQRFTVATNEAAGGGRTVVLTAAAAAPGRYAFPARGSRVPFVWGVGITGDYGVHALNGAGNVTVA